MKFTQFRLHAQFCLSKILNVKLHTSLSFSFRVSKKISSQVTSLWVIGILAEFVIGYESYYGIVKLREPFILA